MPVEKQKQKRKQKQGRKKTTKRPEVRTLKIQPRLRHNAYSTAYFPEILLKGNWLQKLGFESSKKVNVTTMNRLLIIRPEE